MGELRINQMEQGKAVVGGNMFVVTSSRKPTGQGGFLPTELFPTVFLCPKPTAQHRTGKTSPQGSGPSPAQWSQHFCSSSTEKKYAKCPDLQGPWLTRPFYLCWVDRDLPTPVMFPHPPLHLFFKERSQIAPNYPQREDDLCII